MMIFILLFAVMMTALSPVHSRSTGAPAEACSNLTPQHAFLSSQTTPSPYNLSVDIFEDLADPDLAATHSYKPGTAYNLVLQLNDPASGLNFHGFFIQARLIADDSDIGGFIDPGSGAEYQLSSCSPPNIGATHVNADPKTSVTIQWTAPAVNTGPIVFRYSFVKNFTTFWANLQSVNIIERRCDIETGPYYDSTTGNCVFSCPIGFQGVFATGTCDELPTDYRVGFTADTYFRINNTSIQNRSTVFEFTIVLESRLFTSPVASASLALIKNDRVERIFRLSNGELTRSFFILSLELNGKTRILRESVIALNNLTNPIQPALYDFDIIAVIVEPSTQHVTRRQSTGLVQLLSVCDEVQCMNGGTCVERFGLSASCNCSEGFDGNICQNDLPFCQPDACMNGGTCVEGLGTLTSCNCSDGFSGASCEIDESFCTPTTCLNGGTCIEEVGSQTRCMCADGFTDLDCGIDLPDCRPDVCLNGGTCVEGTGPVTSCNCPSGFSGDDCGTDLPFCQVDSCLNGGTCIEGVGNLTTCRCLDGFIGESCEIDLEFCDDRTCQNGGTCEEGPGSLTVCTCSSGFTGANCQREIRGDDSTPALSLTIGLAVIVTLAILLLLNLVVLVVVSCYCHNKTRKRRILTPAPDSFEIPARHHLTSSHKDMESVDDYFRTSDPYLATNDDTT